MNCNEELLNFLDQAPTAFHTIAYVRNVLKENDYEEITGRKHMEAEGERKVFCCSQ
jgi:aspartyl aminopeptidase